MGVTPAEVVCGCGSDELIEILLRLVWPSAVVTCSPSFAMYRFLGLQYRIPHVDVPRLPAPAFDINMAPLMAAVKANPGCIGMVFISLPLTLLQLCPSLLRMTACS